MPRHRRPQRTVSNNPPHDNFDPADALESLHTRIVELEAIAHAAGEAVTRLPHASTPTQRRDLARIYTLVTRVANDATAAAAQGDKLIAALSLHLSKPTNDP
jgi:hypothetical protein